MESASESDMDSNIATPSSDSEWNSTSSEDFSESSSLPITFPDGKKISSQSEKMPLDDTENEVNLSGHGHSHNTNTAAPAAASHRPYIAGDLSKAWESARLSSRNTKDPDRHQAPAASAFLGSDGRNFPQSLAGHPDPDTYLSQFYYARENRQPPPRPGSGKRDKAHPYLPVPGLGSSDNINQNMPLQASENARVPAEDNHAYGTNYAAMDTSFMNHWLFKEISHLTGHIRNLGNEVATQGKAVESLKMENTLLRNDVAILESKLTASHNDNSSLMLELDDLQDVIMSLKSKKDEEYSNHGPLMDEMKNVYDSNCSLTDTLDLVNAKLSTIGTKFDMSMTMHQAHQTVSQAQQGHLKSLETFVRSELDHLRSAEGKATAYVPLTSLEDRVTSLETKLKMNGEESAIIFGDLNGEVGTLKETTKKQAEVSAHEFDKLKDAVGSLNAAVGPSLASDAASIAEQQKSLKKICDNQIVQLTQYGAHLKRYGELVHSHKGDLREVKNSVRNVQEDLDTLKVEHSKKIAGAEGALKPDMSAILQLGKAQKDFEEKMAGELEKLSDKFAPRITNDETDLSRHRLNNAFADIMKLAIEVDTVKTQVITKMKGDIQHLTATVNDAKIDICNAMSDIDGLKKMQGKIGVIENGLRKLPEEVAPLSTTAEIETMQDDLEARICSLTYQFQCSNREQKTDTTDLKKDVEGLSQVVSEISSRLRDDSTESQYQPDDDYDEWNWRLYGRCSNCYGAISRCLGQCDPVGECDPGGGWEDSEGERGSWRT